MQQTNTLTTKQKGFSAVITAPNYQNMITAILKDPSAAARFTSTVISVVNANPKLRECEAGSIISAALHGEVGLSLSLALGEYAVVPYGKTASFQLMANGIKQLAVRTGAYAAIDFFEVRQGELTGRDLVTRDPIFSWKDDDERANLPIIGYYGFFRLINGFTKTIYWTRDAVLKHADTYSKAFSLAKYKDLLAGKLEEWEVAKLRNGTSWYADPDSTAHTKMCLKTIAKQLLSDGLAPKSVALKYAISADDLSERTGEPVFFDDPTAVPDEEMAKADDAAETFDKDLFGAEITEADEKAKKKTVDAIKKASK